jgi:hypothetical protein
MISKAVCGVCHKVVTERSLFCTPTARIGGALSVCDGASPSLHFRYTACHTCQTRVFPTFDRNPATQNSSPGELGCEKCPDEFSSGAAPPRINDGFLVFYSFLDNQEVAHLPLFIGDKSEGPVSEEIASNRKQCPVERG